MHIYRPQDAHYSKKQFSLHYTVAHHPQSNGYIYHLSDNLKRNHSFTKAAAESLVKHHPENNIYRFKSDNGGEQYKCLNVFPIICHLAMKPIKTIIRYCGIKGYRKGLVDAMSGLGLKTPLRKVIVTEDVFDYSAQKVYEFISEKMKGNEIKIYECLEISSEQPKEQIKIPDNRKCHMISYFLSSEIQIKEEICSCDFCYDCNFIKCDDRTSGPKG